MNHLPVSAEDILAGHPDRLCDAIAESIVERACTADREALVGVEVALHRHFLAVTGRVAATAGDTTVCHEPVALGEDELVSLVREQFGRAGYRDDWGHEVRIVADLDVGVLGADERAIRRYSDDQGIAVGYADPRGPKLMPVEVYSARRIKDALTDAVRAYPDVLGPDGKVLVRLGAVVASGMRGVARRPLEYVNIAVQHRPGVGFEELHRLVTPFVAEALEGLGQWVDTPTSLDGEVLRLNGIGDFTCGGPLGDNGLSGKKLVVDHYGPHVPIGGGAICGKDPHKPDRVGALRARQLAVRLAHASGETATVHLGWLPGLEEPDRLWAALGDGRVLDADGVVDQVCVPDLSLAGSAVDLALASVEWSEVVTRGYFGNDWPWER